MHLLFRIFPVFLLTPLILLAQNLPEGAPLPEKKGPDNLLDLIVMGGEMMVPILICSVIALTIIIERLVNLQRSKVIPSNFVSDLHNQLGDISAPNISAAVNFCQRSDAIAAHIFLPAIQKMHHGPEVIQSAIEDAGGREVGKLKRKLKPLSFIATISPLLGLLGTVYGMIEAFQAASNAGHGKSDMLAEGIYVALVTTAAGLTLAIPVLIVHQFLSGRVDSLIDEIDNSANDFLDTHTLPRKEAATAPVSPVA